MRTGNMAGNWKEPEFDFSERSDRVTLKLEVG
jgi:ATP-dependent DNA helicase RecG